MRYGERRSLWLIEPPNWVQAQKDWEWEWSLFRGFQTSKSMAGTLMHSRNTYTRMAQRYDRWGHSSRKGDVISPTIIDGYKPSPAVNNQHLRSLECFVDCTSAPQNVKEEGEDAPISQNGTELYVSFPVYGANWARYMSSRGGYTIEETVSSKLLQVRKNASYFWH